MDHFKVGDVLTVIESNAHAVEIRLGAEVQIFNIKYHSDSSMHYADVGSGWAAFPSENAKQLRIEGVDRVIAVLEKKVLPDT